MLNNEYYMYNTLEHTFKGVRLFNGRLTPVTWKISARIINIEPSVDSEGNESEVSQMASVYYQVLKWWMSTCLDEIIICHVGDVLGLAFVNGGLNNDFMLLPVQPLDDSICEALFRKLTALSETYLRVIDVTLYSDEFESSFYYNEKAPRRLPAVADPAIKPVHKHTWWDRNDLDLLDPVIPENATLEEVFEAVETYTALEEVKEQLIDAMTGVFEDDDEDETETEVVDVKKWNPKKI